METTEPPIPKVRFPSPGRCIYCDAGDADLTDEHIVPLGLGGRHIIDNASCRRCAAITSQVEGVVLQRLWGHARNAYNFPSRRKARRPKHIDVVSREGDLIARYDREEYPAPIWFYEMPLAGILQGQHPDFDFSGIAWFLKAGMDDRREAAWKDKYGTPEFSSTIFNSPRQFSRMLAKIAYCQVVATVGLHKFSPIVRDFIIRDDGNPSYFVGRSVEPVSRTRADYCISTLTPHLLAPGLHKLVGGRVHLLPMADLPAYDIVVGTLR